MNIIAPGVGRITLDQMIVELKDYLQRKPNAHIIVGSDSQRTKNRFCFATAIAAIDPGNGGIFYIRKEYRKPHREFKTIKSMIAWKVYREAEDIWEMMSLLVEHGIDLDEKITHHDLSQAGLSGEHIAGITGWMKSLGFQPEIKPTAVIASGIANLYSKK